MTPAALTRNSVGIVYTRESQRISTYANSVWVDTPARMLMLMMVAAIESTSAFPAVVNAPSAARADIELDTEILRLQQDFSSQPSRVRFSLRASLVDSVTRRVLASEQFDAVVDSTSEDARGGVVAAHAAVRIVLTRLALRAIAHWPPQSRRSLQHIGGAVLSPGMHPHLPDGDAHCRALQRVLTEGVRLRSAKLRVVSVSSAAPRPLARQPAACGQSASVASPLCAQKRMPAASML